MKKSLKISAALAGVLIIGGTGVYMSRNALIKHSVEKIGPRFTQTTVILDKVDFRPFSGHLSLQNLRIGNPKGFSDKDLFALGSISVDLRPKSLFGKKIIIDRIAIDKVSASYEIANGTNNIAALQKNITDDKPETAPAAPAPAKASAPAKTSSDPKKESKPAKQVVIKELTVKDAEVAASISGIGMTLPLPTIRLTGIGENKPSTFKEALTAVVNVFSTETLNAIANATTEAVKSGAGSLKNLLNKLF